jgi:hypothetical protein
MIPGATPAKVAYALQRAGEPLARQRACRSSGAVVKRDGNSVVVKFYSTSGIQSEARIRQRMNRWKAALTKRGFSVTSIPDEVAFRVL